MKRTSGLTVLAAALMAVLALLVVTPAWAQPEEGTRHFLYLSDKRIVTVELIGSRRVIVNYINLDDAIELLTATGLLVVDADGKAYSGHVFKADQPTQSGSPYYFSELIKPRQFKGYDVLGDFRYAAPPARAFFRVGSRIVELEPLRADDFELAANKIVEMDLQVEAKLAIVDAGFWRGYGNIHSPNSSEIEAIRRLFPQSDPLPPVLVKNPRPLLLQKFQALPDPVVASLRINLNSLGGIVGSEVISAPNPELGEQALETVRNSWEFLPAISKGKPADAELVVQVVFDRQK